MIGEVNPLAVVVYKAAFPIQVGVRVAADAVFLFEKCYRCIRGRYPFKELIDAKLSLSKSASVSAKLIIDVRLRNRKSGKL